MAALILVAILAVQDDFPQWIARLSSDSLAEREEATNRLRALGEAGLERLGKAKEEAKEAEVRARIDAIIVSIKKSAEFAKVFGPTRRVTIAARGVPLKDVLKELGSPDVAAIEPGGLDGESRIDFQIRGGTWWEALDGVARAAGGRYRITEDDDGRVRIAFVRGKEPDGPVVYAEQFRIAVVEVKLIEFVKPGEKEVSGVAVVELRRQPGLKPKRGEGRGVTIEKVLDAKGGDVKREPPSWDESCSLAERPLGFLGSVAIDASAAQPLTLIGTTGVLFPRDVRDVALDLEGDGRRTRQGNVDLRVADFKTSEVSTTVVLRMENVGTDRADRRVDEGSVFIVDSQGGRHPGSIRTTTFGGSGSMAIKYEFTSGIPGPKRLVFKWVAEYHEVALPFRLEGIRLPEFKPAEK